MVDDEDYDRLSCYHWHLSNYGYAHRSKTVGKKRDKTKSNRTFAMHREVLGDIPKGMHVDHINGDKLDNCKANLRISTPSQNVFNSKAYSNNTTGVKGVCVMACGRFRAKIGVRGRRIELGKFKTFEEAISARRAAEVEHFGEFARSSN